METFVAALSIYSLALRSYPTYEEWKPALSNISLPYISISSYPTYEEWKLLLIPLAIQENNRSYPTYEEWKQYYLLRVAATSVIVLILPMRNGNIYLLDELFNLTNSGVLILPMRNGNRKGDCSPYY